MIYKFIDQKGTFLVKDPQRYNLYFPLTDQRGSLLSSISPNLAGDIKRDNGHFLTSPASIEDIRSNPLCRRDFFIKTPAETIRLSAPYEDTLEAGLLYHKLSKRILGLEIEILNFIPHNIAVEVMRVRVRNNSRKALKFTPTSFIPLFGRGERNLRDHRHVSSLFHRIELQSHGLLLKPAMAFDEEGHRINKMNYFVLGFEGSGRAPVGQFPTLDYFYGEGDILSPKAIEGKIKPLRREIAALDGKEACAALRFADKRLKKAEEAEYILIMGIDENRERIKKDFLRLNNRRKVERAFIETKDYWQKQSGRRSSGSSHKDFNNWLIWVSLQPTLRRLFGCSFLPHFDYGKGGRGWRDLWQDALALIISEPAKAKKLLLHNFNGVRIDGSNATIITRRGDFLADRNRISRVWMDHGVWPFLSLNQYIERTGDLGIILKQAAYFKDQQLRRAKEIDDQYSQTDQLLRTQKGKVYRGSILEHILVQNLVQFFNVGKHNIVRLENADWNDGLDMAAKRGESAAFSFMYADNLKSLACLLQRLQGKRKSVFIFKELAILLDRLKSPVNYNSYREKQKRLESYFSSTRNISGKRVKVDLGGLINDLQEKSGHLSSWLRDKEWLDCGFFNGYYDNRGRRVEGKSDKEVRMMLPTQVFAIMSGVATEAQVKRIWASIGKYLRDKRTGGFRLNTDFGFLYTDLGRAFGFSYGDKENGAFFSHMVVMLSFALYKRGFHKEGAQVLDSIYKMSKDRRAQIYPMIPEYFDSLGKGRYLYLTGSASWYIYTLNTFCDA
ncbi:GH36-type glycosyl hydrolase domain-containing protein [Candidatus Omnitrophota bacterium]